MTYIQKVIKKRLLKKYPLLSITYEGHKVHVLALYDENIANVIVETLQIIFDESHSVIWIEKNDSDRFWINYCTEDGY